MRTILLALFVAACGGPSKPAPAPAENVVKEEPPPPAVEEEDESENDPYESTPSEAAQPLDQASLNAGGTGILVCDELVARTMCMYKVTPGTPPEAVSAFQDSIAAWKEAALNETTRQALTDACKMSLDAGHDGYAAQGC